MEEKPIALTVLSNGGGQDTTMLIHRLCTDPIFYQKYVEGDLLIVGSDTGAEHPHTYENIKIVEELCKKHGVEFYWVGSGSKYHSESWASLTHQYKKNKSVGSAAFRQTCTDNLKVKVVDRFVEQWIANKYYLGTEVKKGKKLYHRFYEDYGRIKLILGFAAKEESRTSNGNKFDPVWKKKCIVRAYPLIEEGIDRQKAIDYNERAFTHKVFPSNCMICFYSSEEELVWLHRFHPEVFEDWVKMEEAKLSKYAGQGGIKNLGVYGNKTLRQKLAGALIKFGDWSDERLNEYKYSHGHCIKSKY